MNKKIKWTKNNILKTNPKESIKFHKSFDQYTVTPLANYIGLSGIYVKDESYRFGLNAFKVLGGSFAMGNIWLLN